MKTQIEYGLQGSFQVKLFSGKKLMDSTEYFSNFITVTGLQYPVIYSFADCFRFLSLGSDSSTLNLGGYSNTPTTGLAAPILSFNTSVGTQSPQYIGWQGYETGSEGGGASSCGTQVTAAGPRMFRGWSIPTGTDDVTMQNAGTSGLFIGEFMVSPSSGSNPTGCKAFSRIPRNLFIPNGYKAIITYQLKVNIQNTGITPFGIGTFNTGNAEVSNDYSIINSWQSLSGYYRQVYHGLRCVDSAGATFVPKFGDGMEPSCKNISRLSFYFSPDNSQFDTNTTGGFLINPDEASSYSADGLMGIIGKEGFDFSTPAYPMGDLQTAQAVYYNENPPLSTLPTVENVLTDIRLGMNGGQLKLPHLGNYLEYAPATNPDFNYQVRQDPETFEISYATPGISGWNSSIENYGKKAVFSTKTTQLPINTGLNAVTGRSKIMTRKSFFSPVSSLGYNTRFASLVYGYRTVDGSAGDRVLYPIIDTLFYDTNGKSTMNHYRLISGIVLTERGTGVSKAYVNIRNNNGYLAENIQRFNNRLTFQGPIIDGDFDFNHTVIQHDINLPNDTSGRFITGKKFNTDGAYDNDANWLGYGAVYGTIESSDEWFSEQWDCGLVKHDFIHNIKPSNSGTIYWPEVSDGNELVLEFNNVEFHCPGDGISYLSGDFDSNCVGSTLAGLSYQLPSGYIFHTDFIGSSGGRLLPNHGIPNNQNINYYLPQTGGWYPALSMDNGMEIYLDITWNSPCGGASKCAVPTPPVLTAISIGVPAQISVAYTQSDSVNVLSYNVWRKANAGIYALYTNTSVNPYIDSIVTGGTAYCYKIKASGMSLLPYESRESDFSNELCITR